MNRKVAILTLLPIFLSLFFVSPTITRTTLPPVHATTIGEVCITDPTATTCPINPETLTGPIPPTTTQLKVGVFINDSSTFSAFDVTLLADHTILKPAGALNNGVFSAVMPISKCIGGVQEASGAGPCPQNYTQDTVELEVLGSSTPVGFTGLLFTAVYNITGSTPTTPIGFQTGCGTPTQPSSVPPLCITISAGANNAVQETDQTGSFSNQAYYAMATSVASLTVFNGTSDSSTIVTLTSLNSFTGTVSLTASVSPPGPNTLSALLTPPSLSLTSGGQNSTALTITAPSTANIGNYNITITGNSGTQPANSVRINVIVPPPDFTITATRGSTTAPINMNATTTTNTTIIVTSTGGFAGTVNLQQKSSNPTNMSTTLTVTSVTISASSPTSTSVLKLTSPSDHDDSGSYTVNVTATSGSTTHSIIVTIIVADFLITPNPASVSMIQGGISGGGLIFSSTPSADSFFGQINLTATVPANSGMTVSCTPVKINFTRNGNTGTSPVCSFTASKAGTFQVTFTGTASIIGTSRPLTHSVVTAVIVSGPDFTITIPSNIFSGVLASPQTSNTTTVLVAAQVRFNGTVTLSVSSNPTGPTLILPGTVMINTTFPSASVLLTILTPATVPTGNYIITVTGTSMAFTHNANVTLNVVDFTITANPTTIGPLLPAVTSNVKLTIGGINGFTSTVTLTTIPSSGLTISPISTTIPRPGSTTLTVSAASLGTYTLLVVATSGPVSHNVTIIISVSARPDLAIGSIAANPTTLTVGGSITFIINVQNLGAIPENATVAALVGDQTVATTTILLQPNSNQNVTLLWNTSRFSQGAYVAGAKILQVPNELILSNNLMRSTTAIVLTPPSNTGLLSISQDQSIPLVIGILALVVITGILVYRRSRRQASG